MGFEACMGAVCQCSFGMAPSSLTVTPENKVLVSNLPGATIMDNVANHIVLYEKMIPIIIKSFISIH